LINQKLIDQVGQPRWSRASYRPSPAEGGSLREGEGAVGSTNRSLHLRGLRSHQHGPVNCDRQEASGTAIKDNIHQVTQGSGKAVGSPSTASKKLRRRRVDYAGASGPCDFDEKGDILGASSATSDQGRHLAGARRRLRWVDLIILQALINGLVPGTSWRCPPSPRRCSPCCASNFSVSGVAALGAFAGTGLWRRADGGIARRGLPWGGGLRLRQVASAAGQTGALPAYIA
jgi:hypothetical protein